MKKRNLLLATIVSLFMFRAWAAPPALDSAKLCAGRDQNSTPDLRIQKAIAQARRQHEAFGGQLIERSGGIVRVGYNEAEFDANPGAAPTWKRVAGFWAALDESLPATFRSTHESRVNRKRLYERIIAESPGPASLEERHLEAIQTSFLRNALIDHPWSAAFISFVMKSAEFQKSEFEFSESHVDYVDRAVISTTQEVAGQGPESYAYRACDVLTTKPRAGDLLCYTREEAATLKTFDALVTALSTRRREADPPALPMHCDLVVSADQNGDAKIETIGGNVYQSVTLRKMTLNETKTLGTTYLAASPCPRSVDCAANLSRKPWVVLLQYRR